MGGYNAKDPLIPRLQAVVEELYAMGKEVASEDVEEAIAVLEGRLALNPDGTVRIADSASVCDHEWVDARNEVIASGEWCRKCNAIRAADQPEAAASCECCGAAISAVTGGRVTCANGCKYDAETT